MREREKKAMQQQRKRIRSLCAPLGAFWVPHRVAACPGSCAWCSCKALQQLCAWVNIHVILKVMSKLALFHAVRHPCICLVAEHCR